ncbi:NADPH-dependent FMN reductase [Saccharothrix syringae]|uniref:NADPH-dependent oxidoreductase n=1 Tax=Saccharothrix syringae TaxID=103733 RepID=A0A5Q0GSG6_SACSY|nr:NAD(P)H-dependent oxidoreductase [Saccharothrix syringae]QFZ17036.1 NADPH-dependent oxidoreductase [Saccharothrix syringae]
MADTIKLAVIVGSTRRGRFAPVVAGWFADLAAQRADLTVDVLDLADLGLPDTLPAHGEAPPPEVVRLSPRLAAADAFTVVTPEYNHSFPAPLKSAIDWHGSEWHAKPVAFVSYGGLSGGLRAVEQLRQVFAELHAVTVRDTVSFHGAWSRFDEEGNPLDRAEVDKAATTVLDRLVWWGTALKEARAKRPYGA